MGARDLPVGPELVQFGARLARFAGEGRLARKDGNGRLATVGVLVAAVKLRRLAVKQIGPISKKFPRVLT